MEARFVYADNAATTAVSPEVFEAMQPWFGPKWGNPSSLHRLGREAAIALEDARTRIAACLGAKPREIYFTSCGSESDNWAVKGAAYAGRKKGRTHIITSKIEHHAMLHACEALERDGFTVTYVGVDSEGFVSIDEIKAAISDKTAVVAIMLANNEIGTIEPIAEIAKIAHEHGALMFTDAVQAFGALDVKVGALGVDMLSLSGHKIHAPKGIGLLYVRQGVRIENLIDGGGQERGLRSGTEATAQVAGFAKAVELRLAGYEEKLAHMAQLKQYALEQLLTIDGVVRIGNGDAPHILSVSLVGYPSANVVTELGAQGICISAGSACHRGKLSHVYAAMKLDKKTAAGVLRVSFAPETTREEIDAFVSALRKHKETRFPML